MTTKINEKQIFTSYLIIGAGCSGLSLAIKLIDNKKFTEKVILLEARENYFDDRSWCFWEKKCHILSGIVSKKWYSWTFSKLKGESYTGSSKKFSYQYIRSIDFYKYCIKKIKSTSNFSIINSCKVNNITKKNKNYIIKTNHGSFTCQYIIDTRPKKNSFIKET